MKNIWSTFTIAAVGGLVSIGLYSQFFDNNVSEANNTTKTVQPFEVTRVSTAFVPVGSMDFTTAAERTIHAVVHVKTEYVPQTYYNPWSDFFGGRKYYQAEPAQSAGSGVIISPDGYIVTNNHVIAEAEKVEVTLNNNKTYKAEIIGSDPSTDIALLKIDDSELPFLSFGNSDDIKVGEWVLAVGNPFNLTSTVTAGIVSAKARNINLLEYDPNSDNFPIESFIQTDAAVNPGNSGGALVNISGDLVGINTAIASRTGSYTGYSFAIPASIVQKITNDLFEFGTVQRAFIGVSIGNINDELMAAENLKLRNGAFVRGLSPGGAAADAGIEAGDIITKINGVEIKNVTELQEQVGRFRPGDNIVVAVNRKDKELLYNVTLRNKEGNTTMTKKAEIVPVMAFGANLEPASKNDLQRLKLTNGVIVKNITPGKISKSGIKNGFIIVRVDKQRVNTPQEVADILERSKNGVLIEGIYPNGVTAYYGFGL
jgi:serine protease Do